MFVAYTVIFFNVYYCPMQNIYIFNWQFWDIHVLYQVMKKMFQDLKELDQERLSVTKEVIQQYIKQISPPYDLIRER